MKHIVLTGGGTAGHVTPNIALIPTLKAAGYQISYIGSYEGIERKLIEEMGIPYYGISSGKLRRYFDPKNFSDPFRVLKGFHEAKKLLKTETFTDEEKEACQKLCDFIEITLDLSCRITIYHIISFLSCLIHQSSPSLCPFKYSKFRTFRPLVVL
mgnify:CR=1 FL=1